jgi:hypothetical protein
VRAGRVHSSPAAPVPRSWRSRFATYFTTPLKKPET